MNISWVGGKLNSNFFQNKKLIVNDDEDGEVYHVEPQSQLCENLMLDSPFCFPVLLSNAVEF